MKKQISAIRTYWAFLAQTDTTLQGRRPFDTIVWPKVVHKRTDPTRRDFLVAEHDDGPRFTPAQVCALWDAAHADGDIDLRDAIVIAAYTGARREGVFGLHTKTVLLGADTPHVYFFEKTLAGQRRVPVHPAIMPILARRAADPEPDGYLFRGGSNIIKSRGARLTNPMRSLLTAHGFGRGFGFHSFRRTFIDFLQRNAVAESHAARIVGHEVKTITYGLYAGELPREQALSILVANVRYPRTPSF